MTLTKHHIEVTMPANGKPEHYTFPNWKEACAFIEIFKPEWVNCKEVED